MLHSLPALFLVGVVLAACGGDEPGGTTITSTPEGIDGAEASDDGVDEEADDDGSTAPDESAPAEDDDSNDATAEDAGEVGPSGAMTIDGVDYTLERIDRCVPTDQTTERIEAVDGIDSFETLNLVARGAAGMFEMYYSDAGVRSVTFSWNGDEDSLDGTYSQVVADADWLDAQGTSADGEPLQVVNGVAVGGAVIDGRELRFELPIPAEASC